MKVVVVGCGLIGSAAARHLATAGHEVVAIGPREPADKRRHKGVFASHYDEGRITRSNATDPFWSRISRASIARYGEIAAAGGVAFFTDVGAMMAGPEGEAFIRSACQVAHDLETASQTYQGAALAGRFPFFAFPQATLALHEPRGAGHISPRKLVDAQLCAARAAGAHVPEATVLGIEETEAGVRIRSDSTDDPLLLADRVLIATGAMTDHLAPRPLHQRVYARTVALFEVTEAEARRLSSMPSLVFREAGSEAEPYLLPPIRYPDGRIYLKLGGDPVDRQLHSAEEIGDWFRSGGNGEVRDHLEAQIRRLMPDLAIERTRMDACVTTFTPSGKPVIDWLSPRIATASGGNGAGAKCSDELGRLAAELVTGADDPLLAETKYQGVSA